MACFLVVVGRLGLGALYFIKHEAKELLFTHHSLFKTFVVVDEDLIADLFTRYQNAVNRTTTTKSETFMVKALTATHKTLEPQQDSLKKTLQEHAKKTKADAAKWIFDPLLKQVNTVLDQKAAKKKWHMNVSLQYFWR